MQKKWVLIIIVLVILALISLALSALITHFFSGVEQGSISAPASLGKGNIALISIKGTIMSGDSFSIFSGQGISSEKIVREIERADEDQSVKAILLEIDSPGGTAVASQEIAEAVKASKKFKVAWIRETGASGAYWVASAADKIVASPLSITGSIGVLASYLDFSGFLNDYNITYQRIIGGKYKDIGSPYKTLTLDEREILQDSIDSMHSYFIKEVAKNRNLPLDYVEQIATGAFYTGLKAKELGLIDELGGKEDAINIIEEKLNIEANVIEYKERLSFLDALTMMFSDFSYKLGQGIGSALFSQNEVRVRT